MEKYTKINEQLKNMAVEGITNKGTSSTKSILWIVVGIVLFALSMLKCSMPDALKMALIVFGICFFLYGIIEILMGLKTERFYYQPTGKRLKKYVIYIQSEDRNKLHQMFDQNNFQQIDKLNKTMTSGCLLYIMATDDGACCAMQIQELVMDVFEATSDTVLLTGEQSNNVLKFIKA
ncbi:MAG: DUF308 domain-containing protein [Bacteroidales bacterium]|nr:DUF308 domain-containing protein [Bacteroidales bacterium]